MKHWLAAILLAATAGSAAAQSYQTALPLSPAERRSLEARLSTILEYANADEATRFALPSGRSVTVLPYRKVRSADGQQPCRGYRIDLEGRQSRTAVDGFRCKRRDGEAWTIVEPELVLAQEGTSDQALPAPTASNDTRGANEPLYPGEDLFGSPSAAANDDPPPLPRPAPRTDIETATAPQGDAITPSNPAAPNSDRPFASRVAALLESTSSRALEAEPAPARAEPREPARPVRLDAAPPTPEPQAKPQPEPARQTAASSVASEPTRVVSETDSTAADDFSRNDAVVGGLRDLDYLTAGDQVTPDAVAAAVDAFSVDERFALPVSTDVLVARLGAAIERSRTLPDCAENSLADLCAIRGN